MHSSNNRTLDGLLGFTVLLVALLLSSPLLQLGKLLEEGRSHGRMVARAESTDDEDEDPDEEEEEECANRPHVESESKVGRVSSEELIRDNVLSDGDDDESVDSDKENIERRRIADLWEQIDRHEVKGDLGRKEEEKEEEGDRGERKQRLEEFRWPRDGNSLHFPM